MDSSAAALLPVLILLASSVLAVAVCRSARLPPMIRYLIAGVALGPHVFGVVSEREETHRLAELGVVFLMFSIGLEFSLTKLKSMRRLVFGLGAAQVGGTIALGVAAAAAFGGSWQAGLALGGIAAMSSTAIVSKLLAERGELDNAHGREVIAVLLFQDLAFVPLLVLVPVLAQPADAIGMAMAVALAKAAAALFIVIVGGPKPMRLWLRAVARRRSSELFVLNVLLITLVAAFITAAAGLSLVLGAFLAGMLISETEYRFQVEQDIRPFRDVLLGLFFITVGMMLDPHVVGGRFGLVVVFLLALTLGKFLVIFALSRGFGAPTGTAMRVALALAQGGEFGFVLLPLAGIAGIVADDLLQPLLAAMIVSMLATPFVIAASDRIVLRVSRAEWMQRSLALHRIAVQSIEAERHVIIVGYGRNGQRLARLLDAEGVRYVALDLDPERVREAAAAGDTVVFADGLRREALIAAGIARAAAVVLTFADAPTAVRVLAHVHELNPSVPVIVRARDEGDIAPLSAAGASEVVPEAFESGLMLASHTLVWVGVPLSRVMRRVSQVRGERYGLLQGLFVGRDELESGAQLHSVRLELGAGAIGRTLDELALPVQVRAVRRPGTKAKLEPQAAGPLQAGDVVVLLGTPEALAEAEERLAAR